MNAIEGLKVRTVNMFNDFVKHLNVGYQIDYSNILHNISFIENCNKFDNITSLYEKLMSHG